MLHHVATLALQNKILAEAFRVLRPGGVLIGSDSLASNDLHHFRAGDTYNPIEAASVLGRLQTLGFEKITIMVDGILKFVAHKPGARSACGAESGPGQRHDQRPGTQKRRHRTTRLRRGRGADAAGGESRGRAR
jgi:SAM-dependent methyltransferase